MANVGLISNFYPPAVNHETLKPDYPFMAMRIVGFSGLTLAAIGLVVPAVSITATVSLTVVVASLFYLFERHLAEKGADEIALDLMVNPGTRNVSREVGQRIGQSVSLTTELIARVKAMNKQVADLDFVNFNGANAKLISCASNEVFQLLIKAGYPVGSKLLDYVKDRQQYEKYRFLLENTTIDKHRFRESDVHTMLLECPISEIENLRKFGFSLDAREEDGKTALITLASCRSYSAQTEGRVKALLAAGANAKLTWKDPSRSDPQTAAQLCGSSGPWIDYKLSVHEALVNAERS